MELPKEIKIIEVGPRDGLQNLKKVFPAEAKAGLLKLLFQCGFKKIEAVSFVSPKQIPQMADAETVVSCVQDAAAKADVQLTALVPNFKGAVMAESCGIKDIRFVVSVSERHNYENTRQTIADSLIQIKNIREAFPDIFVEVTLATSFGCSYRGFIPPDEVIALARRVMEIGADHIGLSDTVGMASPLQVEQLLTLFRKELPSLSPTLHFHDTGGMGLANVLVSLQLGFTEFDASIGGLGGCPFAPGAAGNIATEDLNHMLLQMGIKTGIHQDQLLFALSKVNQDFTPCSSSHMARAKLCISDF